MQSQEKKNVVGSNATHGGNSDWNVLGIGRVQQPQGFRSVSNPNDRMLCDLRERKGPDLKSMFD
jgi:hypothetical protein